MLLFLFFLMLLSDLITIIGMINDSSVLFRDLSATYAIRGSQFSISKKLEVARRYLTKKVDGNLSIILL